MREIPEMTFLAGVLVGAGVGFISAFKLAYIVFGYLGFFGIMKLLAQFKWWF